MSSWRSVTVFVGAHPNTPANRGGDNSFMALAEIHLNANNALNKMTAFTVLLPEAGPGPFPVLYLLHGLSDDHTAWTRRTRLESHVDGRPLIVVMPDGGRGFYTDSRGNPHGAYETFILRDLIPFVDRTFHTRAERGGRAVAGLSMGGFGAVKLALRHPDLFCAGVSHSGALRAIGEMFPAGTDDEWTREFRPLFGPDATGGPDDVYALAEKVHRDLPPERWPALRLDCGTEDFLLEPNRRFHAHLDRLGLPHEYAEHPGAHDWEYWDRHVRDTLAFLAPRLGVR